MKNHFSESIRREIAASRAIATVTIENTENVKTLAEALLAGGIRCIEITLRTPVALESMQIVAQAFPEMQVIAGTVIAPEQIKAVQDAGAVCAVAPGMNRKVIEAALDANLPFAPGVATPSEIETALEYDCDIMKLFPAEPLGGLSYLKNMQTPYAHLGIQFIPLGGLNAKNAEVYLQEAFILAVGGSWIAKTDAIKAGDWAGITARAAALTSN
ncbi:MAG: 2-dehydro-3-deoxy-phosphogluconate aldolase [Opitutia bacterium UBA7350]|nr:MAG: 2-dehydro-3-deoxy-phosphogluconate aldolase [Opitutae bacterium UBA7350]